jgi:hypothetical protein
MNLDVHAEITKLARALEVEPDELEYLEAVTPETVRELRYAVADAMFEAGRPHFARIAAAAKVMPGGIGSKLAQHALGPLLGARAAVMLHPDQARDLAKRLPSAFLADVAIHIDVRHAGDIIAAAPADRIAKTAAELDRRKEFVAMAGFVGSLTDEALELTLPLLSDDAMLRTGFLLEHPERLDVIVAQLPDERLVAMAEIASDEGRIGELVSIVDHLGAEQRQRVVDLARDAGADDILAAV